MTNHISVLAQTPAHSSVSGPLTYKSESLLPPGTLVRVPLGTRETLGVVWDHLPGDELALEIDKIRSVLGVLDGMAPLGEVLGRERGPVVPGHSGAYPPGDLHCAVRGHLPVTVLDGRDPLGQTRRQIHIRVVRS